MHVEWITNTSAYSALDIELGKRLYPSVWWIAWIIKVSELGVVVATDERLQWMLPWWWKHYTRCNSFPIAFIDLGMTQTAQAWCKERGLLISLPITPIAVRSMNQVSARQVRLWEKRYTANVWLSRKAWFQKPLAFLSSPFPISLWLDLDCEVAGSLQVLFDAFTGDYDIGIVRDQRRKFARRAHYNSGVVIYKKGLPLLENWAQMCMRANGKYMGDENILSSLLRKREVRICELPAVFNWLMYQGINLSALIHHWGGSWGKEHICRFGGVQDLLARDK